MRNQEKEVHSLRSTPIKGQFRFCCNNDNCKVIVVLLAVLGITATLAQCEPITLTYQVTSSADDGDAWGDDKQKLDWVIAVGYSSYYVAPYYMGGFRFTGVEVPQGSIITEARLMLRVNEWNIYGDREVYGVIQAEASDNAPNFNVSMIGHRIRGSAGVNWDHIGSYTPETWHTSPDISGVIQEVVNRVGWTVGNSLVMLYCNRENQGNYIHFTSYDESVFTGNGYANAAKLVITYEGPVLTISGYVQTAGEDGIEDVLVSGDNGGGSDTTDYDGYYEIEVPDGWMGTVTVSKSEWRFEPESRSYNNLTEAQVNQNYDGFLLPVISGYVRTVGGLGVEGVVVTADNEGESDTTEPDGYYELILPNEWSGTVTPSKNGWGFAPSNRSYNSLTEDQTDQDYTAFLVFAISGYVTTAEGVGCKGVLVSADNGGGSDTTDYNGYYELMVPDGWSGMVTPSRDDWEFNPASWSYNDVTEDQPNGDYIILGMTLTTVTYQVSGSANDADSYSSGYYSDFLVVGYDYVNHQTTIPDYMAGMRFTNVQIPGELAIIDARLKMQNSLFVWIPGYPVYGVIQAEAGDDTEDFGSVPLGGRAKTDSAVNWDHMDMGGSGWWYTSPDISEVVQEIIDRPGWAAGNSMVLLYSTRKNEGQYRQFWSSESGGAPKLTITYAELVGLSAAIDMDELWMYQSMPGKTGSTLTASVSITDDPMGNSSYSYAWEIILPGDVSLAPVTAAGGGAGDASWTFAARGCDEPAGLSDSGQTFKVRVRITGDDYGNTGVAQAEFGISLLGDVNNDAIINVADRSIANAFWRLGSVGAYTFRDCDVNSDGIINVADRSIANAVWRGLFGQNSVSSPCPLR